VLLLDEPTRGIDIGAKNEIYTVLDELLADGLAVLVASSETLELLGLCDRILVLHEGGLEASGTHAQLLAQGGRYAELFELQAAGYR